MRFTTALALAAALLAAPVSAAEGPTVSDPAQIIDGLSAEGMTALLTELGAQKIQVLEETAKSKRMVFFDGDVPFNASIELCDLRPGKCVALLIIVIMDGGSGIPLETINKSNESNLFITAIKGPDGKIAFGRVTVVDGGVTKQNLAMNVASFVVTFQQKLKALQNQVVASAGTSNAYLSSNAPTPLRPVFATPQEFERFKAALLKPATTLRRPH